MRTEPSGESELIDSFKDGTILAVIDKGYGNNGLWLKVFPIYYDERGRGEIGFVHSKWVRFFEEANLAA